MQGRWSLVGWAVSALLLGGLIVALALTVRDGDDTSGVSSALAGGKRPVAPALPTDRVPGLHDVGTTAAVPKLGRKAGAPPLKGPLVVNWWASWCGPCRDEMPLLVDIAGDYRDDDVTIVGVNIEDIAGDARDFVDEYSVDYPIVRGDADDKATWGVRGVPETFVVGVDGRISGRIDGPVDERSLRALIEKELQR